MKWIFQGWPKKIMWIFQGTFGLGIPKGSNKNLWNFQGWSLVLPGIFRGKVKKWKISGGFQKSMCSILFFFFWNSPIKRCSYYIFIDFHLEWLVALFMLWWHKKQKAVEKTDAHIYILYISHEILARLLLYCAQQRHLLFKFF